ncbi:hypothetical protein RHGRI_013500 [Rhododendron griersonianum]|uniref:Protein DETOXIFICATION n=1 Tax=Rhododendron griersonianum TaxID=479676 RepID=A0AAV6K5T3_9ERIC|nr:hypothetical protein RHGRI_013500 [Rhododendron griersonianum]
MDLKTLARHHHIPFKTPKFQPHCKLSTFFIKSLSTPQTRIHARRDTRLITACSSRRREVISEEEPDIVSENAEKIESFSRKTEGGSSGREEFAADQSIWNQIGEIVKFSGPATGLWICGPLMSLIDTAVIGQGSSLELAALGPGTVLCDNMSYVFMFLSIATSNMVATSLARRDKEEVQHQISILLFVGLTCGVFMFLFMRFLGAWALTGFAGVKNAHIVPAANKYVQIRAFAWPAVLVGWVAQSASLGMKDSWGPLKALVVASTVNIIGHIILCSYLGYGIAGAAWATMGSQVISAYMMIEALNNRGYNAFSIYAPSPSELKQIIILAAPVFLTISSKVAFYSLIIYFATSMGTVTVAAHQARMLLKSLVIIGALLGLVLGTIGTSIPLLLPGIFTSDPKVIQEMQKVLIPFFIALCVTPSTHSFEGTLLAGRDLKFISLTMTGCFCLGSLLLLIPAQQSRKPISASTSGGSIDYIAIHDVSLSHSELVSSRGYGLQGCWCALVGFQWARFFLALRRLLSPDGVLYSEDLTRFSLGKLKAT